MRKFDESRFGQDLLDACTKAAETALRVYGGSNSSDVVQTVAERFAACARTYANRAHEAGHDESLVIDAVHFVADVLVHGEVGADVKWFDASLDAVLELAAPTRARSPAAKRFISAVARQLGG